MSKHDISASATKRVYHPHVPDIDRLFYQLMAASTKEYEALWNTVILLLCLSYDQAATERGFSVNKEVEVVANYHLKT